MVRRLEGGKVGRSLFWALTIFLLIEVSLQVRAHFRYGASIFNAVANQQTYQFNEDLQLKLLRPSSVISGSEAIVETNSLGLRSPELGVEKRADELRVAILGASTVMGTYTKNNEDVLSYRLQAHLEASFPERDVQVINGGIAGYILAEQQGMLERVLQPLDLDLLVWHPGSNDVSLYCRQQAAPASHGLPTLKLPKWLLSVELVVKNTVWLRSASSKEGGSSKETSKVVDIPIFRQRVNHLLDSAKNMDIPLMTLASAKAFRREMVQSEQVRLSETAIYYNHCFDLDELYEVYDQHNEQLIEASRDRGFPTLRLDRLVPGGDKYFGDATHFTAQGTDYVASLVADEIIRLNLLGKTSNPDLPGDAR